MEAEEEEVEEEEVELETTSSVQEELTTYSEDERGGPSASASRQRTPPRRVVLYSYNSDESVIQTQERVAKIDDNEAYETAEEGSEEEYEPERHVSRVKAGKKPRPMPRSKIRYDDEAQHDDGRNLTDKEYLYRLIKKEKELAKLVIEGTPYSEMNVTQKVRESSKIINDSRENPYTPYREIRLHTAIERGLRVRPLWTTRLRLASSNKNQMAGFSDEDRAKYKMVVLQMIENFNFISAKHAHKRIECENPTKDIRAKITKYYH